MDKMRLDIFNILNMCKGFEVGYSSSMGKNVLYIRYNGKPYYISINEMEDTKITERLTKKYCKVDEIYIKDMENIKQLERLKGERRND